LIAETGGQRECEVITGRIRQDTSRCRFPRKSPWLEGRRGTLHKPRGTLSRTHQGRDQERDRRAGTQNTPGIVGLSKAAELALECMDKENAMTSSLRNRLEKGLLERVPKTSVNGNPFARLPNTTRLHVWRRRGRSNTIAAQPPAHCLLLRLRRGHFRDFSASPNDPKGAKYLMGLHIMKCTGQTSGRAGLFRSRRRWWLPPAASNSPTQSLQPLRRFHIDV